MYTIGQVWCCSLSVDNATEFFNPGRGWYYHTETLTSSYSPLDYEELMELRNTDRYTLLFRNFVLDSFRSQPISNATLQKISDDLTVVRSAYFKLVIRFSYTITFTSPRNDAPKSVILQHVNQLLPVLTDHADVILAFQHGFIGTWGEGYYTDYFGDEGNITSQQQEDRQEVYDVIISTVPECIMVPVRTWAFKEKLTGSSMPVSIDDAYTCGNDSIARNARTGIHDDCFLASETDYGTWTNSTVDRPLISSHSQYTIFGGETCNPDSDRNACPVAVHDLSYFHFTYLNMLYHPDVIQRWKDEGCYDTITEKLGYRLVLVSSQFPEEAVQGENMDFTITLRNDGFSAPVSAALLKIILLQGGTKHTLAVNGANIDPRFWTGNATEHVIMGRTGIPKEPDMNGTWNIFLVIIDTSPGLQEASQYNIIAVNQPPTSATDGMNDLQRTITISTESKSVISYEHFQVIHHRPIVGAGH